MSRFLRLLGLSLLLPATMAWAEIPERIELEYAVETHGLTIAHISEVFSRQGSHYHIESESRAVGIAAAIKPETIRVVSDGDITAEGLRPHWMSHERKVDAERSTRADFDWMQHQVTLKDRSGVRKVELPDGTQDRLSAMYQFLFLSLARADHLAFQMSDGSRLTDYAYRVADGGEVKVTAGGFKTRYLRSQPEDAPYTNELWIGNEGLPVAVKGVVTEADGSRYTQSLLRVNIHP
jgi:hypothetical protein